MNTKIKILIAAALILSPTLTSAKVVLPPFFSDNMVLQQKSDIKVWGTAAPHAQVKVTPSWDGQTLSTVSDAEGKWSVNLQTPSAGGPYTITFAEGKKKKDVFDLSNVLVGEVWLCTGQSNMELKIDDKVNGWEEEKANASSLTGIRLLHVENTTSPKEMDDIIIRHGGWKECSSENIADFSAAGYFFGKYINEKTGVPVGLIETCWGGTLAEAWTGQKDLYDIPYFRSRIDMLKDIPVSKEDRVALFEKQMKEWEEAVKPFDKGFKDGVAVWSLPETDDSDWTVGKVPGFLQEQGLFPFHDFFWMRKSVNIPASWLGSDLTLEIGAVDDNDFTYFNGVRVGHTEGCISPRKYTVPASAVREGVNTIGVRVMDTGGMSGILGGEDNIVLKKSDTEKISLTGEWKCKASMSLSEAPDFPVNTATEANYPSFLYNAMIYPLRDYKVKGAIWYQGEANTSRAAQYKDLLPLMIRNWRHTWGYDFPFYIVQLANYMKVQTGPEESEWAALREAQLETAENLENTGLAVIIDIGEAGDIHPKNKAEVGRRLGLNAIVLTYGEKGEYSGPIYSGYTIEDNAIRVKFDHVTGGLKAWSYDKKSNMDTLEGFYIAGGDHVFHKAEAKIDGNTVVVSSKEVPFPVSVRYAWADNPVCNLYNGENLPASPFRTDAW